MKYAEESAMGLGCIVMIVIGLAQMAATGAALVHWGVPVWLSALIVLALMGTGLVIVMIPLTFFGALLAWDWHWTAALALAAPGLVLLATMGLFGGPRKYVTSPRP
jgi:hypothetical protein